jgi:hypothetical protein
MSLARPPEPDTISADMRTREDPDQAALWIGPSARMGALTSVLSALGSPAAARGLERVADLPRGATATVIVDADAMQPDDWLDLRRFLAGSESARLVLLGDDASRRDVRALLRHEHARWMSWPPDLDDLRALAAAAGIASRADATAAPHAHPFAAGSDLAFGADERLRDPHREPARAAHEPDSVRDARAGEIEEIERILGTAQGFAVEPAAQAREPEDRAGRGHSASREPASAVAIRSAESPDAFRHQVADLADIAQRLELGVQRLRDAHAQDDAGPRATDALDHTARDVARLVQFARTLGYLVAPPGPGEQTFDLAELLELFLSEIRTAGPDAPRCLLRSNGALAVRSDRQLLTQAFDALFCLARNSAGRGEIVRVQARRDDDDGAARALVSIDFPAGRLSPMSPEAIVAPYGLRAVYPELGANALSAAMRIIEGQGGSCALAPQLRGRMEWSVSLPLATVASA